MEERLVKVKDEALAALVGRIHGGKERMGLSVLRGSHKRSYQRPASPFTLETKVHSQVQ